jgi:SAM-dependent methyltransferase
MWKSIILVLGIAIGMGYLRYQISKQFRSPEPNSWFAILPKTVMAKNEGPSQQLVDIVLQQQQNNNKDSNDSNNDRVIMELGPGLGYGLEYLLDKYQPSKAIGIELSTDFYQGLQQKFASAIASQTLTLYNQDAKHLPFLEDDSVDGIYALNVIYFLHPLDEYLQELVRVLKPGGTLVFGVYEMAKRLDPSIFVNQDWNKCLEAMKRAGLVDAAMGPEGLFARSGVHGGPAPPSQGTTLMGTKTKKQPKQQAPPTPGQ